MGKSTCEKVILFDGQIGHWAEGTANFHKERLRVRFLIQLGKISKN